MDAKELLKKYWFIGVIGIALLVFIGIYAADAYKNREITVNTKQVDGKYVAYTVDGEDIYADDLYEGLYETYGLNMGFLTYERAILNNAYETTKEMTDLASQYTASVLSRYSQSEVEKSLKANGYSNGVDDLQEYYVNLQKRDVAIKEYVTANKDKYVVSDLGTNGRLIYHILVKTEVEEVKDEEGNVVSYNALPTEEQTTKLNTILEALAKEDADFEMIAYQYSEDGSYQQGGYIGVINEENKDSYYPIWANKALELKDGEISEVITTQAGYHILYDAGSTVEALLDDYYYLANLESQNPDLIIRAILEKGSEAGFEIVDADLKQKIESQLTESEAE